MNKLFKFIKTFRFPIISWVLSIIPPSVSMVTFHIAQNTELLGINYFFEGISFFVLAFYSILLHKILGPVLYLLGILAERLPLDTIKHHKITESFLAFCLFAVVILLFYILAFGVYLIFKKIKSRKVRVLFVIGISLLIACYFPKKEGFIKHSSYSVTIRNCSCLGYRSEYSAPLYLGGSFGISYTCHGIILNCKETNLSKSEYDEKREEIINSFKPF